jgi:hypothetical protein
MKTIENISYYLYSRGLLSKFEIKSLIQKGYLKYIDYYLYDPVEKEFSFILKKSTRNWEYENWEYDYSTKNKKKTRYLEIFESRMDEPDKEKKIYGEKARVMEIKTLLKAIRTGIDKHKNQLFMSLSPLVNRSRNLHSCLNRIDGMKKKVLVEKLLEVIEEKNGNFKQLWQFLDFDDFVEEGFSGPVMVPYRKILSGLKKDELGQYFWVFKHKEFNELYLLCQIQIKIAKAFKTIIFQHEELFIRKLKEEFNKLAYSCATLLYSGKRWIENPHTQPSKDEQTPFWLTLNELVYPKAWAISLFMDHYVTQTLQKHFFKLTKEKYISLSQLFLQVLFDYYTRFEIETAKDDFINRIKKIVSTLDSREFGDFDIFNMQKKAGLEHHYWGSFFKSLPEDKWIRFLNVWWDSLTFDYNNLGALWLNDEKKWQKRIVGYEAYIDLDKFIQEVDPVLRDFYSIFCPKKWDA